VVVSAMTKRPSKFDTYKGYPARLADAGARGSLDEPRQSNIIAQAKPMLHVHRRTAAIAPKPGRPMMLMELAYRRA